jgi:anti-sigma regulatory factor (Ser/Thr protein kinase)
LDEIIHFIEESASMLRVGSSITQDVVLATMEAVTNILTHGYKETPGFVEIEVKRNGKSLFVCFRDLAETFDLNDMPAPDISLPLDQRPRGGLGVHLIRNFVDEMSHHVSSQGGNELICIKKDVFLEPAQGSETKS